MAKQFIRVADQWMNLLEPRDTDTFLLNPSGTSVHILISDIPHNPVIDPKEIFTVGGLISQLKAPKDAYIYAKAVSDIPDNEAILVSDSSRITGTDHDNYKDLIDSLAVQIMRLTERVTNEELKSVRHSIDYTLFIRKFLSSNRQTSKNLMTLQNQIIQNNSRIFAAERYIQKHRNEFHNLLFRIKNFGDVSDINKSLDKVTIAVSSITTSIDNINHKLNDLIPRVEEAWGDYKDLLEEHITPIQKEIADVHFDFVTLNNAMVSLSEKHTAAEIEAVFKQLILGLDEDIVRPITTLKNMMVDLAVGIQKDKEQDESLKTKLDEQDRLVLTPDNSIIFGE